MKISEYVSLGHPDKIADYISQYLLDRYIEKDPETKYALEVQIKNQHVTLGGEISSHSEFTRKQICDFVREAVDSIGYDLEYRYLWGKNNAICGDDLIIHSYISHQSRDIAKGEKGWGDQGIFFGYATPNKDTEYMPKDHHLAKLLCKKLFDSKIGGLDIKTQVAINGNFVEKVIVAIPLMSNSELEEVESIVRENLDGEYQLIINGTGKYEVHSSIADCGTTGRKLAVDFYGGNGKIGGGSPWTKDASKADLTLNLYARKLAKEYSKSTGKGIEVALASCIGKPEVDITVRTETGEIVKEGEILLDPRKLKKELGLDKPIYASMCKWGLFGEWQKDKAWEK